MQNNIYTGLVLLSILVIGLYLYSNKYKLYDNFQSNDNSFASSYVSKDTPINTDVSKNNFFATNPKDLLPSSQSNIWTTLNPISQTNMVIPDVLSSDYFIGVNTSGLSKKFPNLQNREDPIIAKMDTSGQWNNNSLDDR
jgi:hypothetical protein